MTYDYVIVGSGAAGCVLASRLSADQQNRVLLIEAGPADRSPLVRMPNGMIPLLKRGLYAVFQETEPQAHLNERVLFDMRGKVLGGGTSINGIQHSRGVPKDYDWWAELGNKGWSYGEVLPYFKKSESFSQGGSAYRGGNGPFHVTQAPISDPVAKAWIRAAGEAGYAFSNDLNGEVPEGFGPPDEAVRGGRRVSAVSAYLKPALRRKNLTVITAAHVQRLLMSGKRCTGVDYLHHGEMRRAEAGTVVLSAGVYGSPQLLMLSGIGNPLALREHGIASTVDLPGVGQNLQDHLGFMVSTTCPLPVTDLRHMRPMGGAKAALDYLLLRKGFLARSSVRAIAVLRSEAADAGWPDLKMQFFNLLMDDGPGIGVSRHGYLVRISMTRPQSVGEVTLRSADPSAMPRINANYLADPRDMARARSGVRIVRDLFGQPAMAQYRGEEVAPGADAVSDEQIDTWLRSAAGGDAHGIGTCRMGHDDKAVVDPQLRVHGVEGLRVIDASVMPAHICGNTVAPTMMVAEKGADMILNG